MLLKDIPYLMIQGVWAAVDWSHPQMAKTFINSKIFYEIDEDKFIGWPIMWEIGGYTINNILNKLDPEGKHLRISDEDRHPNAEGHKIMAQELYNAYEKIYT
jgi:lysophospholipase L1-like esterase